MSLKIAIAIATAGRADVLSDTLGVLAEQSRIPDELLICPARSDDLDASALDTYSGRFSVCHGALGLTAQRNLMLRSTDADVVVFFDDDFIPARDYVAEVELLFEAYPKMIMATGTVLADGITGPGLTHLEGLRIVEGSRHDAVLSLPEPVYNGYGCNMAVRMDPVRRHGIEFDERLPLYGWLEDVDFSRRLARYGGIVRSARLRGVHLGTKGSGRSPGRRLGYSQIANPIYLARKGTMSWERVARQICRNLVANSLRSLFPEPWTDRIGRLAGNGTAILDLLTGKLRPENALRS
jgi:GT2 family glycosyltransferase